MVLVHALSLETSVAPMRLTSLLPVSMQYGSTEIGNRGGIYVPGVEPWVDLR